MTVNLFIQNYSAINLQPHSTQIINSTVNPENTTINGQGYNSNALFFSLLSQTPTCILRFESKYSSSIEITLLRSSNVTPLALEAIKEATSSIFPSLPLTDILMNESYIEQIPANSFFMIGRPLESGDIYYALQVTIPINDGEDEKELPIIRLYENDVLELNFLNPGRWGQRVVSQNLYIFKYGKISELFRNLKNSQSSDFSKKAPRVSGIY